MTWKPIDSFIRETQILKVERIKICKSNNPAKSGGLNTTAACCGISYPGFTSIWHLFINHILPAVARQKALSESIVIS
jgi:hypothetical protein